MIERTARPLATISPTVADQFNRIIDLAVILVVVPYIGTPDGRGFFE